MSIYANFLRFEALDRGLDNVRSQFLRGHVKDQHTSKLALQLAGPTTPGVVPPTRRPPRPSFMPYRHAVPCVETDGTASAHTDLFPCHRVETLPHLAGHFCVGGTCGFDARPLLELMGSESTWPQSKESGLSEYSFVRLNIRVLA